MIDHTDWGLATLALTHSRIIFLSSEPGMGKTYTAMHEGLGGRSVYSITATPETPASEGRGFYMPRGGNFEWVDGVFIRAMREGARLVINEISNASEDVLAMLYPILEAADTACLTLPTGETVHAAPGFQCVVTDNADEQALSPALQSRLTTIVHINQPHPEAMKRVPEKYRAAALRAFTIPVGDPRRVTLRAWLNVANLEARGLGAEEAFVLTLGRERGTMLWEATHSLNAGNDVF